MTKLHSKAQNLIKTLIDRMAVQPKIFPTDVLNKIDEIFKNQYCAYAFAYKPRNKLIPRQCYPHITSVCENYSDVQIVSLCQSYSQSISISQHIDATPSMTAAVACLTFSGASPRGIESRSSN